MTMPPLLAEGRGKNAVWTISLLYFATFFALASQGRFIALFLGSYGVSSQSVGIILATGTATSLFSTPVWAAACDVYREKRNILICCVCGAMLAVTLHTVPWLYPEYFTEHVFLMAWLLLARSAYCFFFIPVNTILDSHAVVTLAGQCTAKHPMLTVIPCFSWHRSRFLSVVSIVGASGAFLPVFLFSNVAQ